MSSQPKASKATIDVARKIAQASLSGECDLLLACRQLSVLLVESTEFDRNTIDAIVGVASETDDIPFGDQREYWAADALRNKDAEAAEYLARVRRRVETALRSLLFAV